MSTIAPAVAIETEAGLRERFLARARRDPMLKIEPGCRCLELPSAQAAGDTV